MDQQDERKKEKATVPKNSAIFVTECGMFKKHTTENGSKRDKARENKDKNRDCVHNFSCSYIELLFMALLFAKIDIGIYLCEQEQGASREVGT